MSKDTTGEDTQSGEDTTTDTMIGGEGNDSILGGTGDDTISGGEGNDDLEHVTEGLADHVDETVERAEAALEAAAAPQIPAEVKAALEEQYPVLREHGSHDAAMKGLQTDASGSYTPPTHPRFEG